MTKTRSMTGNQNFDDDASLSSSSRKRFKTFDNGGVAPWSDLPNDVLFSVMMLLGVGDFLAFSCICKSWRSVALSNRKSFMASKPPMSISIEPRDNKQDSYFRLKDFEGRTLKTIIPHSAGRIYFGVTCGYMIFFGRETRDFWLVNPITRHELHFLAYPLHARVLRRGIKAILVFLPSMTRWVFVVLHEKISFCIAGKRGWNHVSSTLPILDLHAFKGKIYTLHTGCSLCELRLNPNRKRKCVLHEIKNGQSLDFFAPQLVSFCENLYVIDHCSIPPKQILELDFGEMKWVSPKKTIEGYAFFLSRCFSAEKYAKFSSKCYSAAFKLESCADTRSQYSSYEYFLDEEKSRKCMFFYDTGMWYFPHICMNVNLLDEQ